MRHWPNVVLTALARLWWRRGARWHPADLVLLPLSWGYRALKAAAQAPWRAGWRRPVPVPVPVIVVGNVVVGGAGKTPTVMALVQALQQRGWTPGVVSRGHGRRRSVAALVGEDSRADDVGDEPLLIARRVRVPVCVARDRAQAALLLCARHPQIDVIISDDGRQHPRLPRVLEVLVFAPRGIGNGRLLPAGPLREPMPRQVPQRTLVLYSGGAPSTDLPGFVGHRRISALVPLRQWAARGGDRAGIDPVQWIGRTVHAVAAIADPLAFFSELQRLGLHVIGHPLADHAPLAPRPWPRGASPVILTEKDAVKIAPDDAEADNLWVARLDFSLPDDLLRAVIDHLQRDTAARASPHAKMP